MLKKLLYFFKMTVMNLLFVWLRLIIQGQFHLAQKIELDDRNMDTGGIAYDTNSNQTCAAWGNTQDTQGEAHVP